MINQHSLDPLFQHLVYNVVGQIIRYTLLHGDIYMYTALMTTLNLLPWGGAS